MKFHCQPTGSRRQMLAVCCAHEASCLTVLAHSLRLKTVDEHRVGCDRLGQGRRALREWNMACSFVFHFVARVCAQRTSLLLSEGSRLGGSLGGPGSWQSVCRDVPGSSHD